MPFDTWREEYISAHQRYRELALEYQKARLEWEKRQTQETWVKLQEALHELKRQNEIIELNRLMLI